MSKELTTRAQDFTDSQLELIKATVAKGATNDELKLFLYRCKILELDPLKTGQIYFVKYSNNPGTIVIGLDGFRSIAQKTGKHRGTERGVTRDEKGNCVSAWCKVYRSDWDRPATEEVARWEYDTNKAMWAKIPETMLKKVAECAALRMAFPDDLGDLSIAEELEHTKVVKPVREATVAAREALVGHVDQVPEFVSEELTIVNEKVVLEPISSGVGDYLFKTGPPARKGKKMRNFKAPALEPLVAKFDAEQDQDWTKQEAVQEDILMIRLWLVEMKEE